MFGIGFKVLILSKKKGGGREDIDKTNVASSDLC